MPPNTETASAQMATISAGGTSFGSPDKAGMKKVSPPSGPREGTGPNNNLSSLAPEFTPGPLPSHANQSATSEVTDQASGSWSEEVDAAAQWWTRSMKQANLAQSQINAFEQSLRSGLTQRCDGHWYPSDPMRGSGHRSVICSITIDPILIAAAQAAGVRDLVSRLPKCIVWVNPGAVRVQLEDDRHACTVFSTSAKSPSKAPGSGESDDGSSDD